MADRLPIREPRFVHFTEPGTTLQSGEWTGPTHVMVMEHRSDETSLIIRPFLDADEDDSVNEPGDLLENLVKVTIFLTDPDYIEDWRAEQKKAFGDVVPASTLLIVSRLARPEFLVEVEAIAARD